MKPGFSSEGNPYQKPKTQRIWPTTFLKMGGGIIPRTLKNEGDASPPSPLWRSPCQRLNDVGRKLQNIARRHLPSPAVRPVPIVLIGCEGRGGRGARPTCSSESASNAWFVYSSPPAPRSSSGACRQQTASEHRPPVNTDCQ